MIVGVCSGSVPDRAVKFTLGDQAIVLEGVSQDVSLPALLVVIWVFIVLTGFYDMLAVRSHP